MLGGTMKIKWEELSRLNDSYFNTLTNQLNTLNKEGNYILAKNVSKLEKEVAKYIGVRYCIAVGNGLDALTISLKSLKLPKGYEVIVPSNTFYATVLAILRADLTPILCEPNIDTYNIEASAIEKLITDKTVAIIPVHLYGKPCEMDKICNLAKKYNIKVIEDCAQAFGAEYQGKKIGSFGELAAFSFYPTKNLGSIGDGGMIATNDESLYKTCKKMRNYGGDKYHYDEEGINSRMDEIQAMFLLEKLKDIDKINDAKIANAKLYLNNLDRNKFQLPIIDNNKHIFHIFNIRTKKRNELMSYLKENGIDTIIHYPVPIYKQKVLDKFHLEKYPISQQISDTVLSLPCSAAHIKEEILYVIDILNNFD